MSAIVGKISTCEPSVSISFALKICGAYIINEIRKCSTEGSDLNSPRNFLLIGLAASPEPWSEVKANPKNGSFKELSFFMIKLQ